MDSDDEDDVFAHPGQLKRAARATLDDVSSDEDEDHAWLKSGKEKKAALAERERKKREDGTTASSSQDSAGAPAYAVSTMKSAG